MQKIKYIKAKNQFVTEGEVFTWVGDRQQELLDLSPKYKMYFQDCLGQFVVIDEKHFILEHGDVIIFDGHNQMTSTHAVPSLEKAGERINLTFRSGL